MRAVPITVHKRHWLQRPAEFACVIAVHLAVRRESAPAMLPQQIWLRQKVEAIEIPIASHPGEFNRQSAPHTTYLRADGVVWLSDRFAGRFIRGLLSLRDQIPDELRVVSIDV